jgi:hypothetical protein
MLEAEPVIQLPEAQIMLMGLITWAEVEVKQPEVLLE